MGIEGGLIDLDAGKDAREICQTEICHKIKILL